MRLPIFALPVCAVLATAAAAQTQSVPSPSSRPQEAAIIAAPRPYREEAVTFDAAPGVRLSGTMTLPVGPGPFPAALLISGSGRNDRDESVAGHKPMMVLADALTRHGYAVLRYDKRGAGQSTGNFDAATTIDFAHDAAAALAYLHRRPDVDGARIGVIGHSEGGTIGALLGVRDPSLNYVVMMAGFATPAAPLVAEQIRRVDLANGVPRTLADQTYELNSKLFRAIAEAKGKEDAEQRVRAILSKSVPAPSKQQSDQALMFADMPYMRFILGYDPTPSLKRLRVPVLALAGTKDLVVPPDVNLPALKRSLAQDPDLKVVELDGLNHFFQPAKTGLPQEFAIIEETLAPTAIEEIIAWVEAHAPKAGH